MDTRKDSQINVYNHIPKLPGEAGFGGDVKSYYEFQTKGLTGKGNVCPTPSAIAADIENYRRSQKKKQTEEMINKPNNK
ncbi:MAG TPA: hypothetical protein VI795_02085 [Patescibacteria group bacterium]|nr:hypothetical protein [Patescibacteria group bacterium]